ncbi:M61 family metallopeptidase [Orrella marina]|uniref:Peptidase M61 n=1 Tax=Orrella marina TaxID=2163011 RepID=A0A2R4XMM8_9BURK|nr:PDZ domain-containing protein [Orrella marina]AWB35048.1 peptidase M61 [Orrella marina]
MKRQTLHYSIDPFDPAGHRLKVTLRIEAPDRERQILSMPAWIPGSYLVRDFSKNIETLKAFCGKSAIEVSQVDSHTWIVENCDKALTVEIVIYAWDSSVRTAHFDDTHCFLNGTSLFLMPHGLEDCECALTIMHPPHASNWRAYTSMPAGKKPGKKDKKLIGSFLAPDYDALIDHPFEIGTPQVVRFKAHGAAHEFVVTGHYPNLDLERIAADTRKICESQIELFEPDTQHPPFLDCSQKYVFMLMVTHNGYGGLEHRASTALMFARRDLPTKGQNTPPDGYTDFLGLVSHEYFHTWHVKRIKPAEFVPYRLDRPAHTRLLWVFEGFTSYYDDLMLLRSGVLDLPGYLKQICKGINQVHNGGGRFKQSLAQSSFDAWTKYYKQDENAPNAIVSYYTKGALAAMGLDLIIRERSHRSRSLDDVMRAMWKRYGRDFYTQTPSGLDESELAPLIEEATGVDVSQEIRQWVYRAEDVPLEALLARSGYEMTWTSTDELPGLDLTLKTQDGQFVVRNVLEGGAAHRAGISAHDKLVALAEIELAGDNTQLKRVLGMHHPGDRVAVHAFRDGVLRRFEVDLSPPGKTACKIQPVISLDK